MGAHEQRGRLGVSGRNVQRRPQGRVWLGLYLVTGAFLEMLTAPSGEGLPSWPSPSTHLCEDSADMAAPEAADARPPHPPGRFSVSRQVHWATSDASRPAAPHGPALATLPLGPH